METRNSFLSLVGVLFFATASFAGEWLTDFEKAAAQAKAESKQLLMDFTGSDWCGWCIRLDHEVFEQKEFKDYADKNLVLLKVDFPRKIELSAAEKEQNRKLSEKYHIDGFPSIVILNPDGTQAGSISGYVPGGSQAFIAKIEKEAPKK